DEQITLSKKNDVALKEGLIYLNGNPFSNATHLLNLQCFLLAKYKKPEDEDFNEFLRVIIRQNNPKSITYVKPEFISLGTTFRFKENRAWTNFFVLENFLKLENNDEIALTVGALCKRASEYLSIQLQPDPSILDVVIAKIIKKDNQSIRHCFHFFGSEENRQHIHFLSLYDQLLKIIFPVSGLITPNIERKKLNAIFLLVFLIGSNPPLYYIEKNGKTTGTGGAFVTDALLQLLLINAGFPPVRKNYLNLIEVKLLYQYATDNKEAYDNATNCYYESAHLGKANLFFHPHSANEHLTLQETLKKLKFLEYPIDSLNCKMLLPIYMAQIIVLSDAMQTQEFQNYLFNKLDFYGKNFSIFRDKNILSALTGEEKYIIQTCWLGKSGLMYRSSTVKEIVSVFRVFACERFEERDAVLLFLIEKIASFDDFCASLSCNETFFTKGERLAILMSVLPKIKQYADTQNKVNYLLSDEFADESGLTLHARGLLHAAFQPENTPMPLTSICATFQERKQRGVYISFDMLEDLDLSLSF
ncbi:MAG: hypothetical protein NTU49_09375, partial [Gammaproteobacteria bacterium]|nr:hypothetical protein [Gammaproteobacteria bacterium]